MWPFDRRPISVDQLYILPPQIARVERIEQGALALERLGASERGRCVADSASWASEAKRNVRFVLRRARGLAF